MGWNPVRRVLEKQDGGYLTQYLAVLTATITLFCAGLYQGWGAPSLGKIMSDEYPNPISEDESSYIIVMGQIGHVIGGFSASFLSDSIGRKMTIMAITIPQILSWTLICVSQYHVSLLYIARILGGMTEGAPIALVPSYIAEIAEPKVRGKLGVFIALTVYFGVIFINTVGSLLTIQNTALVCLVFPVIFLVLFSNMPESPYYLLRIAKTEEAELALRVLRRREDVEKELTQLQKDVAHQLTQKGTFRDLFFIKSNRKALIVVTLARFFQLFTGIVAFMSYNQLLLSQSTNISPFLGSTILFGVAVITVAFTSIYIEKVDRRTILATSALFTSIFLFAQALFLTIKDYTNLDTSGITWLPVLILVLYNISVTAGLATVVNIYIGEIYSTSIKPKALSIGSLTFALGNIFSIKFYQYTADNIALALLCIWGFYFYWGVFLLFCFA